MKLEEVALTRAREQARAAKIVPYERDKGPLEVDQTRYHVERHMYRCRWCGARHRNSDVLYCGSCGYTQQPCVSCGGPVKRSCRGAGPSECTTCRKFYQPPLRRKPCRSRSRGRT